MKLRIGLLLIGLCLPAVGGCSALRSARLLMPQWSGLERTAPDFYVEKGMSAQQRADLVAGRAWAQAAVRRAYGKVMSAPVIEACATEACYERFGGMGSRAKDVGEYILLSPRGLDGHYIAHEWSHAELHNRLGFAAYLRTPSWFDEGVAVAVSQAPANSEAHWQYLVAHHVPRPSRVELMTFISNKQWLAAVHRYGSPDNPKRIAHGEPPITPVYTAAGHELRPWLARAGAAGLLELIRRVKDGEKFATVYRDIAIHGAKTHS